MIAFFVLWAYFFPWTPNLHTCVFAVIQGYTYVKTRSLLYIMSLHLMIDTILYYMISNRWFPGWGWHPWFRSALRNSSRLRLQR